MSHFCAKSLHKNVTMFVLFSTGSDGQLYKSSVSHQDVSHSNKVACEKVLDLTTNIQDASKVKTRLKISCRPMLCSFEVLPGCPDRNDQFNVILSMYWPGCL